LLTPHLDKINAAIVNPKAKNDVKVLTDGKKLYEKWIKDMDSLTSKGETRVKELVALLNQYKNQFEVELIMKQGTDFLRRQKGQLKLDNSIMEEFLIHLIQTKIILGLKNMELVKGPQKAFMSLSFKPNNLNTLDDAPITNIKTKDQDFVVGTKIYYKFSTNSNFTADKTTTGSFILPLLASECKVNLDKTMYQEASGTSARLKQGCPSAKYFLLVEYLDMTPEESNLTSIDNVFLLRHARRLPFEKRGDIKEVEKQRKEHPIDHKIIWNLVKEIQSFVSNVVSDADAILKQGSFVKV
jgi:hypothetical protein